MPITLGDKVIEAELLSNATADTIYGTLPFEAEGSFGHDEIVISAPVYAPMQDGARNEVGPGEIAYRTVDQTIIIGCAQCADALNSELCMAGMASPFARALTDLEALYTLPERFQVKFEVT